VSVLSDELNNDPEGLGYATPISEGNYEKVAEIINEPRYSTVGARKVPSRELLVWGGQDGRIASLKDAAESGSTIDLRAVADAALRMIQREDTTLDFSDPTIVGMVDSLVSAGVFTSTDKSSLETLATKDISRAEQLGLENIDHRKIAEAL
jgi:hypothetical protein